MGAFKDGGHAKTPNLNDLTGKSLRANRALPESMPAVSARRALVTGMRAFPFRDWRRLEGFPSVPGFNPVWDYQPLLIERTREAGVKTIYVTDNPLFQGPRFEGVRAPGGTAVAASPGDTLPSGLDQELLKSFSRLTEATKRTFREGAKALGEVKDARAFLVGIDPFDPIDAYAAPPFYVRPGRVEDDGLGPTDGRMVSLNFSDKDIDRVREAYVSARGGRGRRARQGARRDPGRHGRVRARRPRPGARRARLHGPRRAHLAPPVVRGAVSHQAPERADGRRPHRLVRVDARRGAHGSVVPRACRSPARWTART